MAIPLELLKMTESRGLGISVYGGPGLKKTHQAHELPPPILHLDIGEGGTGSLLPWIRRKRNSDSQQWISYTQEEREQALAMVREDLRKAVKVRPAPLIDLIHFDNSRYEAYDELAAVIANFDDNFYSSLCCDSLQEFSWTTQTRAKGAGGNDKMMNEVAFSWSGAQERAMMQLRRLRNLRDKGIFIYLVGSEDISKDYVRSPFEKKADRNAPAPEAYSIRGTVNMPGKLAEGLAHIPDLLFRVRLMNGEPIWVTQPEALPGGEAHWDAKDRYGRLNKHEFASFRNVFKKLYGEEIAGQIYATGRSKLD